MLSFLSSSGLSKTSLKVWQLISMLFLQKISIETYNHRWLELDNEMQYWICLPLLMSESKYISVDLVWVHLCSLQLIFRPCFQNWHFPILPLLVGWYSHCTVTNTSHFPQLLQRSLLTSGPDKSKTDRGRDKPLLWVISRLVGLCWWEHLSLWWADS